MYTFGRMFCRNAHHLPYSIMMRSALLKSNNVPHKAIKGQMRSYSSVLKKCVTNRQSMTRAVLLNPKILNQEWTTIHRNVVTFLGSLRGQKLRLFKNLYSRLIQDIRVLKNEKVPDGFGRFFPKSKKASEPTPPTDKQSHKQADKPKEIEFKFSFGSGGGKSGGGPDPNALSFVAFFSTIAILFGFSFFKTK